MLEAGSSVRPVRGRVAGRRLHTGLFEADLDRDDDSLRLTQGGAGPLRPGRRFERCAA